jgi:hypothetical protein
MWRSRCVSPEIDIHMQLTHHVVHRNFGWTGGGLRYVAGIARLPGRRLCCLDCSLIVFTPLHCSRSIARYVRRE